MIYNWEKFNESKKSKKEIKKSKKEIKKEIDIIEDMFLEYIDKWKMKHGKYLSNPILQPDGFDDNYTLWYSVYKSFSSKLARLRVPNDYFIELDIEAHAWKGEIDVADLLKDLTSFFNRIISDGWKVVESSINNGKNFLNKEKNYTNRLTFYIYR